MPRPNQILIECTACGKMAKAKLNARGPRPSKCDPCRQRPVPAPRPTECEVCNASLPDATKTGRPSNTCSDACRKQLRKIRASSPERVLRRYAYSVRKAREAAGRPVVIDCAMCGEPVDASVRGPRGDLEEGYAVHVARGTDKSGEYSNCADRYEAMRKSQRLQESRRKA